MFKIDQTSNRIIRLESKRFSELGFSERNHLQEWLANQPDAFGEELLIIQKEFDGFDDTRERLDLLALDKDGNLVIIENKLDDTGRDVVWQAMKYAAYCSTLTTEQIISIYQSFLNVQSPEGKQEAKAIISEFINEDDDVELSLNEGTNQRIFLVAANFRKEVTSAVLWLRDKSLDITCIEVKPHQIGDELALSVNKIIPLKGTEDYLISMRQKVASEQNTKKNANRHIKRNKFWAGLIPALKAKGSLLFENTAVKPKSILDSKTLGNGHRLQVNFSRDHISVRVLIKPSGHDAQVLAYDHLFANKNEIESALQKELDWDAGSSNKAAVVKAIYCCDGYDESHWPTYTEWLQETLISFERFVIPRLKLQK